MSRAGNGWVDERSAASTSGVSALEMREPTDALWFRSPMLRPKLNPPAPGVSVGVAMASGILSGVAARLL